MSDSGNLTLKFESVEGCEDDFSNHMVKFNTDYSNKAFTRAVYDAKSNSFSFFFARCWHFDSDVLAECTSGLNIIINAVYHIWGDGTDPELHYKVQNGEAVYSSRGCDGELVDSEHIDLENLNE